MGRSAESWQDNQMQEHIYYEEMAYEASVQAVVEHIKNGDVTFEQVEQKIREVLSE